MKKILITGANGYIGARLAKLLAEKKHLVTCLCYPKKPNDEYWNKIMDKVIVGDLRDEKFIDKLTDENYDVAIHLVSLDHNQSNSSPDFVSSINVMPTWNLLEKFSIKNNLRTFIYFSTFQVYGSVPFEEITEDFLASPKNTYGLTHLMSENICNFYNNKSSINCINIRLSNSYGSPVFQENNCWWLVINDFCKTAFYNNEIKLLSDGSPQKDFIHSSDVFRAVEILINTQKVKNNTYNVSSGKTFTILELAHIVKSVYQELYKKEIQIILVDKSTSKNSNTVSKNKKYIVSNSKLNLLGFAPKTDLKTGIKGTFKYLEKLNDTKK